MKLRPIDYSGHMPDPETVARSAEAIRANTEATEALARAIDAARAANDEVIRLLTEPRK